MSIELTTPERLFILFPRHKLGFLIMVGFVAAAGRKRKFLLFQAGLEA
jgi:hypothetical protein